MPWEPVPLTGTSSKAISTTSTFRRTLCSYRCPSSLAVWPSYSRYAQPPQCRTEPKRQVSCPNDRFDFSFQRIFLTSNRNFLSNYKVVSKLVWYHFWFSVSFLEIVVRRDLLWPQCPAFWRVIYKVAAKGVRHGFCFFTCFCEIYI